jgi:DNA (cytosine-5)-methyltransferase 1
MIKEKQIMTMISTAPQTYISLFSGIGGLEHPTVSPTLFCERDRECQVVIKSGAHNRSAIIHSDINELLSPPQSSFVTGGWPCQDISSAGKQGGLAGDRSGLFFDMLRVAVASGAHTIIGENVPNLLTINGGRDLEIVKSALRAHGYKYISWRTINARVFGLPQDRNRLFIVGSKNIPHALALHSKIPPQASSIPTNYVHGFYWTGGKRSICYSTGYVPTLKVGAADNNGRGTVAIFDGRIIRKLTVVENLRLQGFPDLLNTGLAPSALLRMAGNAVAKPVGQFVVSNVMAATPTSGLRTSFAVRSSSGYFDGEMEWSIEHEPARLASNLGDFLEPGMHAPLSAQASAGLIVRSVRSSTPMPSDLFDALYHLSIARGGKIHPSRGDSLSALKELMPEIMKYRADLEGRRGEEGA